MNPRRLIQVGIVGAIVSALCCFTPLAVVALAALGLGGAVAWLDRVLWPLLVASLLVAALGWLRLRQARRAANAMEASE
ncbi:MAG TPA: mercury resistance system transport protein MerF [bacterium]|nr:mercury resistance system transport protein MerF [bacterium]